ncbi:MAG TPA: hypothetical protein PLD20_24730 [Blastocatellia bacterium]|nr:hypothetical protein [Blastocatellia bacterium]HMV84822.1 hypothetical protein [Blastocatellia bacterium]HMX26268.1 hypothetical protein [Blastocatellia bacterium]HMY73712.1 hypothetical protein [Blastocatellia bacterium]HMZ21163.1 hypothetical protein [Blastocatellia bacterium]
MIQQLFQLGVVEKLIGEGLLADSTLTDYRIPGYALVVCHRRIQFPAYPDEWCPAMLKEAALTTIRIMMELAPYGLSLKDAHPWNLLYERGRPIWVDLNSLVPMESVEWQAYEEYRRFCLNPLLLMAAGHERWARLMMPEEEGVSDAMVHRLTCAELPWAALGIRLRKFVPRRLKSALRRMKATLPTASANHSVAILKAEDGLRRHQKFLQSLHLEVEEIPIARSMRNQTGAASVASVSVAMRQAVSRLISELRPLTLLNAGGSALWLAEEARRQDAHVVSFSADSAVVTQDYFDARMLCLPLLPLLMDFTKTTPARGLCDHWSVAASERFGCDMVVVTGGALNEMLTVRRMNFEQIAAGLSAFSRRWAVVELNEQQIRPSRQASLEELIGALHLNFKTVHLPPTDGSAPPSQILLCEKVNRND